MIKLPFLSVGVALAVLAAHAVAAPVINEIMFHPIAPANAVEPVAQEWIEIFNPGVAAVDVSGWKFSKGVAFTIPAATPAIPAGGYTSLRRMWRRSMRRIRVSPAR